MQTATGTLIAPYGGVLIDLVAGRDERKELMHFATGIPSLQLPDRLLCEVELLATGAFSPLDRFPGRADYESVLETMRLASGALCPIPVLLPVADPREYAAAGRVALRNANNNLVAILDVEEVFERDPEREVRLLCGTGDGAQPCASEIRRSGRHCLSGRLRVVDLPHYSDFRDLRRTPAQVRAGLNERGNTNVVAFQTRRPLYRADEEYMRRAAEKTDATLLLQAVIGGSPKPDEIDPAIRVKTYQALMQRYYSPDRTVLNVLPLPVRMAGLREALWHAIIHRNYGANFFLAGHDYAGTETTAEFLERYAPETGITPVAYEDMVYLPEEDRYEEASRAPAGRTVFTLSDRDAHDLLARGAALPPWFARPEVAGILSESLRPRSQQGVCLWFTGLPSAGKSTIAEIVAVHLSEAGRKLTMLDGDVVRTHLSKGLGFTREDRDTNILRIAFVAREIVRHGGAVICAAVSPYESTRDQARTMVGDDNFVLIYVATSQEECEKRDVKGFYAKARAGALKGFTGVDDPYEPPASPDLVLYTTDTTPEENASRVIEYLSQRGFLKPTAADSAAV